MRGRNLRRTLVAAGLVAASAVLVLVLAVAGLLAFIVTSAGEGSSWNASMDELSAALVRTEGGYAFTGGEYLAEKELWAMLVDEGGAVAADVLSRTKFPGCAFSAISGHANVKCQMSGETRSFSSSRES